MSLSLRGRESARSVHVLGDVLGILPPTLFSRAWRPCPQEAATASWALGSKGLSALAVALTVSHLYGQLPGHSQPLCRASLSVGGTVTPPGSGLPQRPPPASQRCVCFRRVLPTVISECRAAFLECLAAQCLRLRSLFQQHGARAQHCRYALASPGVCPLAPELGGHAM